MSKLLEIRQTARCPDCENKSLGAPECVIEKEERLYTLYTCGDCGAHWHRSHQPVKQNRLP